MIDVDVFRPRRAFQVAVEVAAPSDQALDDAMYKGLGSCGFREVCANFST